VSPLCKNSLKIYLWKCCPGLPGAVLPVKRLFSLLIKWLDVRPRIPCSSPESPITLPSHVHQFRLVYQRQRGVSCRLYLPLWIMKMSRGISAVSGIQFWLKSESLGFSGAQPQCESRGISPVSGFQFWLKSESLGFWQWRPTTPKIRPIWRPRYLNALQYQCCHLEVWRSLWRDLRIYF
jgi:hypothetical protein